MHGWMEESTEAGDGVKISYGEGTERKGKE